MQDKIKETGMSDTRRDFLKTSAVVAGASLAANLNVARSAHVAGRETVRVGLVGCGGRGTGAVKDALSAGPFVQVVAMGDVFERHLLDSLKALGNDENVKEQQDRLDVSKDRQFVGFDAYRKVIGSGVDVVILATPPGFRPIHLKAAVEAGKHVFMEKPVAVDAPGVRSVLESAAEAKKKGLGLGVGLQRRHQAAYIETIKRLQDGMVGDIISMRVYWNGGPVGPKARRDDLTKKWGRSPTEMEYQLANWYMFNWLCGDHIVEQHIHNLDVANWVLAKYPIRAWGMGGRAFQKGPDSGEIFDHHMVEYEYEGGIRVFSQCRQIPNCWNSVSEHAHGTKGTADISGHVLRPINGETWTYKGPKPNPYVVEHQDLYASIHSGDPLNEGESGALSTLTAVMGRMATYSGREVTWDKALNSKLSLAPKSYAMDAKPPVLPNADGNYAVALPGQTEAL